MTWKRQLVLILVFCMFSDISVFCSLPSLHVSVYIHAGELLRTAGPVPDAVIEPPEQVRNELTVGERLRRFWLEEIIGFRISYASARGKACHANQRVLAGAVAMYNEDHGNTMKEITHADVTSATGTLVVDKFLKSPLIPADTACEYRSHGDLTGPGIIYCTQHGSIPAIQDSIRKELGLPPIAAEGAQIFAVVGISILFLLSAIVLLALFFGRRKKDEKSSVTPES